MAHTIDLETLAGVLADSLQDPTYAVRADVAPDGFVRFETEHVGGVMDAEGMLESRVRATVTLVSDGENAIEGAAGEVFEIVVRRVTPDA